MKMIYFSLCAVALLGIGCATQGSELSPSKNSTEETIIEATYTSTTSDEIFVTTPVPGAVITSPLTIRGQARGTWYFEATAPVVLVDWDGLIIAEGYVTAQGNWMTQEFVTFLGSLTFERPAYGEAGVLIFKADNPSGLPIYDRAVEIPIRFE